MKNILNFEPLRIIMFVGSFEYDFDDCWNLFPIILSLLLISHFFWLLQWSNWMCHPFCPIRYVDGWYSVQSVCFFFGTEIITWQISFSNVRKKLHLKWTTKWPQRDTECKDRGLQFTRLYSYEHFHPLMDLVTLNKPYCLWHWFFLEMFWATPPVT